MRGNGEQKGVLIMASDLHTVMTREQAIEQFKEYVLPSIQKRECANGSDFDEPMRSEAWNDYVDSLCKDRQISDWQEQNWTHPDCCNR